MKAHYVNIAIDRGPMEKVHSTVFEHEVPILRAIHDGNASEDEGSVRILGRAKFDPVELDPDAEYARCEARYGASKTQPGSSNIEVAFGRRDSGRFADHCDSIYGKNARAPAGDAPSGLDALTKNQIMEQLKEQGVEFNKNESKADLLERLKLVKGDG